MRERRSERGFTLLEILVALVVLGFLLVGLTEGVRAGLSLRHAQADRLGQTAELDSSMRLLRRILTRLPTLPSGDRLIADDDRFAFRGNRDRLSFVGNMPTGTGTDRRAAMTLYVDHRRLMLAWRPYRHERPLGVPEPVTRTVLLDSVQQLDLAYWGAASASQPPAWQGRWESAEAPLLIRVRLVFAAGDPRRWPALIAAPRL